MVQAKDLTRGAVVEIDGSPCIVEKITVQSPSARGGNTLYKIQARQLETANKINRSFKGGEALGEPDFERRPVQFLYRDGEGICFMDLTDYEQFTLTFEDLGDAGNYLHEDLEDVISMVVDGRMIGVQLPDTVDLPIAETGPAVRGNSATGRTKPAVLPSGHTIQIPEYLDAEEIIRIDTRTGKYVCRVTSG